MNRKPFNNKPNYDPGRFRTLIAFYQQIPIPNDSGGTNITREEVYSVKAVELSVRDRNQLEMNAGASTLNDDRFFVIRRSNFIPEKDMEVVTNSSIYTLVGIAPIGEPTKYFKLLCIRKADNVNPE